MPTSAGPTGGSARIGEFDTLGTGPHDMALMPDVRMLVIANGGIETRPDYPRAKRNVPTMAPRRRAPKTPFLSLPSRNPHRLLRPAERELTVIGKRGALTYALSPPKPDRDLVHLAAADCCIERTDDRGRCRTRARRRCLAVHVAGRT
ncbi:DUF1513 domain-containing protein [Roseitalea porphyridii]|uniref:DUF1513 domain-containing protein n=1 Tax=Roseitalea porphyridii TaxID=1852022 RepID=UPI0035B55C04